MGSFIFCKVMAGKIFFKPYKLARYFDTDIHDLESPVNFKDNCLSIGYLLIALFTDYIFDLYKSEFERLQGQKLDKPDAITACKKRIFQDMMPIGDDYVLYTDYAEHIKTSAWGALVK